MTMRDTLSFLLGQTAAIEAEVYRRQYEPVTYPELAPVDFSAPDYAASVVHFSQDMTGRPALLNQRGTDIPLLDLQQQMHIVPVHEYGLGYTWTTTELEQAMMAGMNLTADKAMAANISAQLHLQQIFEDGDANLGLGGFVNASGVSVLTAGTVNSEQNWDHKTADQILLDINAGLRGPYETTRRNLTADTIVLPEGAITHLISTRVPDTSQTIYQFIREANIHTEETGMPLRIRALSSLRTAATTAAVRGQGRMICYRNSRDVLKFHLPMPYRMAQPLPINGWTFRVDGMFRTGGLEIRLPGAMRYVDGIWPAS